MRRNQTKHTVQIGTEDCFIDIPISEVLESFHLCDTGYISNCEKCVFEKYHLARFGFTDLSCSVVLMVILYRSVIHYRNMCQGQEIRAEKYKKENVELKRSLDRMGASALNAFVTSNKKSKTKYDYYREKG